MLGDIIYKGQQVVQIKNILMKPLYSRGARKDVRAMEEVQILLSKRVIVLLASI